MASVNMEKEGLIQSLAYLKAQGNDKTSLSVPPDVVHILPEGNFFVLIKQL